jgi:poly(3-hydroxybutyrate) depolymerase
MRTGTALHTLAWFASGALLLAASGCSASSRKDHVVPAAETSSDAPHASTTDAGSGAPISSATGFVGASPEAGGVPAAATVPRTYVAERRTIVSRGTARSFLLATPTPMPPGTIPLVIALHGDGGTPEGLRASFAIEGATKGDAVIVYPAAASGTFPYWTDEGRAAEAVFVTDLVSLLAKELVIDTQRVFLSGFSGGATMANALACILGSSFVRGVGINSGTLYPVAASSDAYTCSLPGAVIVWGTADASAGTTFSDGLRTLDRYRDSLSCAATTTPASTSPCVRYDGCHAPLTWCPIDGQAHAVWGAAAAVMWAQFSAMGP